MIQQDEKNNLSVVFQNRNLLQSFTFSFFQLVEKALHVQRLQPDRTAAWLQEVVLV